MADPITQADVQSLADKLAQFTQSLTPGEQAALAAVIMRGAPQSEDVQGYGLGQNPFLQEHKTAGQGDDPNPGQDPFGQIIAVVRH